MYIWGRLALATATQRRRGPYNLKGEDRIRLRCLPTDIDDYGHMNNARYTMVSDLGRRDLFSRSGIWKLRKTHGWGPLMDGSEIAYLREIRLWKRFDLITALDCWTDRHFIIRHRFMLEGEELATMIVAAVGMFDFERRQFVPIPKVLDTLGIEATSRDLLSAEAKFLESHAGLRALGKSWQ